MNDLEKLSLRDLLALSVADKTKFGLLHTPQEIQQQPDTWLETFDIINSQQSKIQTFLRESGLDGTNNESVSVFLIGAGTSDYIGRAVVGILKKNWKCHVQAIPSTDLMTEMEAQMRSLPANFRPLWISFSRSGDSFEGVKVIQQAIEFYPQIRHLIITCNENGQMASDLAVGKSNILCVVLDKKVNDLGLAMTSSFTNMVIAGQCLAHLDNLAEYRIILDNLVKIGAENLSLIADFACRISANKYSRICFLGSGSLKSVADESALKVLELSGGHFSVMSETFLGLRHGPLSWLNQDSLVIGFVSNNLDKSKIEFGLLAELKQKNIVKTILAILPREISESERYLDEKLILKLPQFLADEYRPPLDILFAQCLGFYSSLHQKLQPDNPSADGKIQRVVSNIKF